MRVDASEARRKNTRFPRPSGLGGRSAYVTDEAEGGRIIGKVTLGDTRHVLQNGYHVPCLLHRHVHGVPVPISEMGPGPSGCRPPPSCMLRALPAPCAHAAPTPGLFSLLAYAGLTWSLCTRRSHSQPETRLSDPPRAAATTRGAVRPAGSARSGPRPEDLSTTAVSTWDRFYRCTKTATDVPVKRKKNSTREAAPSRSPLGRHNVTW